MAIDNFNGDFDFLSNFYRDNGKPTVEHIYQAAKTWHDDWKRQIMAAETPGRAKRLGRKAPMRDDWEQVKVQVMFDAVREKFKDSKLRVKLIDTFPIILIEGNNWHDNFWGECSCMKCRGKEKSSMLGFILMEIRKELMEEIFKNESPICY